MPAPERFAGTVDEVGAGKLTVPIAATFPVERIREAVQLQAGRRVHGEIVVTL
ncbi:zinc-binding dehydrogenase [Streptomyces tendae]